MHELANSWVSFMGEGGQGGPQAVCPSETHSRKKARLGFPDLKPDFKVSFPVMAKNTRRQFLQ